MILVLVLPASGDTDIVIIAIKASKFTKLIAMELSTRVHFYQQTGIRYASLIISQRKKLLHFVHLLVSHYESSTEITQFADGKQQCVRESTRREATKSLPPQFTGSRKNGCVCVTYLAWYFLTVIVSSGWRVTVWKTEPVLNRKFFDF